MQLILDTEPTIDIKRNMSTLNEETITEKIDNVIDDLKSGLCNGNKENIQSQENIISSAEEPITDTAKIQEVSTKSHTAEQSDDAITNSPIIDDSSEVAAKSPKSDVATETASDSPKPDESTKIENLILDDKQSVSEIAAADGTEHEQQVINLKDVEDTTDSLSTEDICLRMEEDSPAVGDQTNDDEDEESDPIIISHKISCSNGQEEQEIIDKNLDIKTDNVNVEIKKVEEVSKNFEVENVKMADKQADNENEKMEVVDQIHQETTCVMEVDTTCLKLKVDSNSINEVEVEKMEEHIDITCNSGKDQDILNDVRMQDEIVENDIQSTSLQMVDTSPVVNNEQTPKLCDTKTPNEDVIDKSNEININKIRSSEDAPKEIETVNLDDEDKETENSDKSLKIENSDSQSNVQDPIENGSVSDNSKNQIAAIEMETVDLIDEKDSSELESMDIDINGEIGEHQGNPISLSSDKDDIIDCEDNLDEVPTVETLNDETKNLELKNMEISMDEDVQSVDDKKSNNVLDTEKEETINIPDDEVKERESKETAEEITQSRQTSKSTEMSKTIPSVLKLSNTLNILSDDEDAVAETLETETLPQNKEEAIVPANKCINIEDDDDIMLIDEEDKESKSEPAKPEEQSTDDEPKVEEQESEKKVDDESMEALPENHKTTESPSEKSPAEEEKPEEKKDENISEAKTEPIKPLVPTNFLKICKKNMAEMTRDDLEEFCILKIVESVVDRSSLSEIKSKLKSMAQGIEEYKKKAQMLQKQNRDLQVVLKTIQEEQKNAKTVTPLKITRSVGMQVLMTERSTIRRKLPGSGANSSNTTPTKTPPPRTPNQRPIKVPASPSPQQIPVPRLVPASNSPAVKNNLPQINATTSKAASPINGVRNNAQKAEKRGINRNHSVTVDLTDDEPPAKIINRNSTPTPLRVVPPHMVPQNLLAATPRHPITQNNNPRKVYIPISGPQSQNTRAGQAIVLKSVTAPNQTPRPRGPQPHMTRMPQNQVRMPRLQNRHPAPLPESTKQYPGIYLKALPPAPDLKLSKVENGIVISWKIEGYQEDSYEEIASYQLYAYQETNSPPSTALWKKIGDVKALPLPMACTLTQFMAGFKYYFAVRAVDIRSRIGPFSLPGSILLLNKL